VLLVNSSVVNLTGKSLGANFQYSFVVSGVTSPVNNGGVILLPNTVVGAKVTGQLTITNAGNAAGTISTSSLNGSGLSLSPLLLPQTIAPGASLTVDVTFAPVSVSTSTGSLALDNVSFVVRGTGTAPAPLPSYSFSGVGDISAVLQQPFVSLQLNSPRSSDVSGTLTLTFRADSGTADDQSIQFASGGRTVAFTIPANTVNAMFGTSTQAAFQTGSVAGTISITPKFTIGTVDLTPAQPLVKSVAIPTTAPHLARASVGARTATSIELLITGYAPSRSMQQLNLEFTAVPGRNLQTRSLTVDVGSAFNSWYQATASTAAGSQFTASVTLNVAGDSSAIQAIGVTVTNANGVSPQVSATLQ
jgi:hypothetical protein